jgi:plasmid maintenance system antidote protein VapI
MQTLMTWDEVQDTIRSRARQMPRGWQTQFARKHDIPRQQVNDMVAGRKLITHVYLQRFLDELKLEFQLEERK